MEITEIHTRINKFLDDNRGIESEEIGKMLLQENLNDLIETSYWCKIVTDVAMGLVTKTKGTRWNIELLIESILSIALCNAVKYINCQRCMSIGTTKWSEEYGLYWCDNCDVHHRSNEIEKNNKLKILGKYAYEAENKLVVLAQRIKDQNESSVTLNVNNPTDKLLFDSGLFCCDYKNQYIFIHEIFVDYYYAKSISLYDIELFEKTVLDLLKSDKKKIIFFLAHHIKESNYSKLFLSIIESIIFERLSKVKKEKKGNLMEPKKLNYSEIGLHMAFEIAQILKLCPKSDFLAKSIKYLDYSWGQLIKPGALYGGPKIVKWIFEHIDDDPWSSQPSTRRKKINSIICHINNPHNESTIALCEELKLMEEDWKLVDMAMNYIDRAKICLVMFDRVLEYRGIKMKEQSIRRIRTVYPNISGHEVKGRMLLYTTASAALVIERMGITPKCPFPKEAEHKICAYLMEKLNDIHNFVLFGSLGFLLMNMPPLPNIESELNLFKNYCQKIIIPLNSSPLG